MTELAGPADILSPPARSPRWNDLRPRILSAAILAPLALASIWFGGVAFAALVGLIGIGLAFEWLQLCERRMPWLVVPFFAAIPAAVALSVVGMTPAGLALLLLATLAVSALTGGFSVDKPLAFGILYVGFGAVALVALRQLPGTGRADVIVLLLLVWASDIGAYLAGRVIGGPKLAPSISPGKTLAGAAGGLVAAIAVGLIAAAIIGGGHSVPRVVCFAALTGCVSQAGDLFESQIKRHFGVKDSGWLIPGHGGLLDRLDALLFAAPFAGLLALLLGRGVVIWQ